MHFNTQQREILLHYAGPLLVLSGAGTGKTAVLTARLCELIHRHHISPDKILALTFTNQAAKEMRFRIQKMGIEGCWIGTFHRLGYEILRCCLPTQKIPQSSSFSIYDTEDRKKVIRTLLEEEKSSFSQQLLEQILKKKKNKGDCFKKLDIQKEEDHLCLLYEERLQASNALDLDDLLLKPLDLFRFYPEQLEKYRAKWSYFLIDEYQDTNEAQAKLLFLLAHPNYNICFVGDPDQAIYSWRGATISNILNIPIILPETQILPLEQNYRSTNIILQTANQLISHNQNRMHKKLWGQLGQGPLLVEYVAPSELEEARQVAQSILTLRKNDLPFGKIAVLYRTHAISKAMEDAFLSYRIPYLIFGGPSFYQRKEIKDALAFLQLLYCPQNRYAAERILDLLPGVGKKCKNRLLATLSEANHFISCLELGILSSFKANKQQRASLTSLLSFFSRLRYVSQSLSSLTYEIAHNEILLKSLKDPVDERIQHLNEFILKAISWEQHDSDPSLGNFLATVTLSSEKKGKGNENDQVQLMTIHYAKGLEFDAVFIIGMEEGLFPIGEAINEGGEALEEERRLCYVAITRAKKHLTLTHAQKRIIWGNLRFQQRSRFLEEMPEELIEHHVVKPSHVFKPFRHYQA